MMYVYIVYICYPEQCIVLHNGGVCCVGTLTKPFYLNIPTKNPGNEVQYNG